jgi:hypothetical protein
MITYTSIGTNTAITLADFKKYANIVGTAKDTELENVLKQAVLRVQEYADRALLPCTIVIEGEGGALQLWQPIISGVTSVVNIETGEDVVADCLVSGNRLELPYAGRWRVTYTTLPNAGDVARLLGYVWEMAAALWDGNTDEEQKVYKRIPADYVVQ